MGSTSLYQVGPVLPEGELSSDGPQPVAAPAAASTRVNALREPSTLVITFSCTKELSGAIQRIAEQAERNMVFCSCQPAPTARSGLRGPECPRDLFDQIRSQGMLPFQKPAPISGCRAWYGLNVAMRGDAACACYFGTT